MKKVTVGEFLNSREDGYKAYWKHENKNKNSPEPFELLKVVQRKILFAGKMMSPQLSLDNATLVRKLASDTGLYFISGEDSVRETIKGMASTYKRQPEIVLLGPRGSYPTSASNKGAAARYIHCTATPLSKAIFKDFDFVPWVVDDSGVEQAEYASIPMPWGLIGGYKGIGVGRGCYIAERKFEDVYNWGRKIIDLAYPSADGSGFSTQFLDDVEKNGISFATVKDIRDYVSPASHKAIQNETKIKAIKKPAPYNFTGAICSFDEKKNQVNMEARIETEGEGRNKRYFITALPIECSDRMVEAAIAKKDKKLLDKVTDHSGKGYPVKLEIPKSIATDKSLWYGLKMKKSFVETPVVWDSDNDTTRVLKDLYPIMISWYTKREEVVTRRLVYSISTLMRKIYNNNLIKKYYDLDQEGKIKTEKDVLKFFNEDDTRYLINLPEKTYIKENVDKLQSDNVKLNNQIADVKDQIKNIKDEIFKEWLEIGEANKKYIEANNNI